MDCGVEFVPDASDISPIVPHTFCRQVYVWSLNSRELVGVLRGVEKGVGGKGESQGHCDSVMAIDASEAAPVVVTGGRSKDSTVKVWVRS